MPIDPLVSLAFSVQSNKGVYALLLGSGISRSAGVPTGWEVVLDLINKLATIEGEQPDPTPEQWFKARHNEEPNYAKLINELTQTAAERSELLRSYFEPTEDERSQGIKSPTPAHRAIAELMRLGYFRVILTTNFDRLLERALRDVGIEPTVVSTPDAIKGAVPLAHARCTIIKLHGDYLDYRLKNTPTELAVYEKPMNNLLDRVLDEFGLIVCGWSGLYDTALRAAIERCPNRRYPMYWTARDSLGDIAEKLINQRKGIVVKIQGADQFFAALQDSVLALDSFQDNDPISQKVAVARIKKYLSGPEHRINFHDLLISETERVTVKLSGSAFPVQGVQYSPNLLADRLSSYEDCCSVLLSMGATAAYWSGPDHYPVILKCLRRLIEDPEPPNGITTLIDLRRYPALLFFYVTCLSAIAGDNYALVARIFEEPIRLEPYSNTGLLVTLFHQYVVLEENFQKSIPGREQDFTPLSNRLFEYLRPYFKESIPSNLSYESDFDWFEYLIGLIYCYHKEDWGEHEKAKAEGKELRGVWGPLGCFVRRHPFQPEWIIHKMEIKNGLLPERLAKVRGAFFPGNTGAHSRLLLAKEAFEKCIMSEASRRR